MKKVCYFFFLIRQVNKYVKNFLRGLYISQWKMLSELHVCVDASPEGKNKAGIKQDTELTVTFIARSNLKLKSSIMQY